MLTVGRSYHMEIPIVLKWPRFVTIIAGIAGIIGGCGFLYWLYPIFIGQQLTKPVGWVVLASILFPIGFGIAIMSLQSVEITQDHIENRHLGFRRRLDLPTCKIDRINSNGFVIVDGDGKRLMINRWLTGSGELYAFINEQRH